MPIRTGCADACGLLARSDAYTCPNYGSGGYSCDDTCNDGCTSGCDDSCDDSCDWSCDFGWSSCDGCDDGCDGGCDGSCNSRCDAGCDTCNYGRSYYSCDWGCTSGCYACPYGTYSAASTSLVSPTPRAVAEPPSQPSRDRLCHPLTQPHHMHELTSQHSSRCTACARRPGDAHLQF